MGKGEPGGESGKECLGGGGGGVGSGVELGTQ